jgi:hypothetical protein
VTGSRATAPSCCMQDGQQIKVAGRWCWGAVIL